MHILLIKTSSMGDVIHALPALTDAFKAIPNFSCDWVVEEGFAEIPSWHGAVRKTIPVALRRWRKSWRETWRSGEIGLFLKQLRREQYDYIIDAQGLLKSAVVTRLARGASYGFGFLSAREPLASIFYQHKLNIAKERHAIQRIRELFAKSLNYSIVQEKLLDYGIKENLAKIVRFAGDAKKYVVFVHGTSRVDKCWQERKWIEMAKLVSEAGLGVMLPWGNTEEKERADRIAYAALNAQVLPKLSLHEIAELLVQANGVITVDTGLGHLAAALDVPTVSLYGPTAPALIGVCGEKVRYVLDCKQVNAGGVWRVCESLF